ncbi:intraflagellar transport 52 -like protein [Brachionus plicatilis]|uniref:Intraflagellar transport 52-like protein n=1 Tax=Brachionus plicatilis TaxID=10195 RepID=A0A3M7RC96_BRAPC|nr:intraflagellar transport 52 -like protein [Brachionus plicatilis]
MPVPTSKSGLIKEDLETNVGSSRSKNRRENRNVESNIQHDRLDLRDAQEQPKMDSNVNILFNQSKEELFSLASGYKKFQRELKSWKIITNRDEITIEKLLQARIFVSVGPQKKFQLSEIDALKQYTSVHNGSVLIMLSEGGEAKLNTNVNFLLEEYGINVNNDCIIRTTLYKYFNPKEALIPDGVLNRALSEVAGKNFDLAGDKNEQASQSLQFVYPFGSTLNVQKPAAPLLSSGSICFPIKRPLCAIYGCSSSTGSNSFAFKKTSQGRVCALGSSHIFHDSYIDKEENRKLLQVLIKYLTDDTCFLDQIDSEDPDVNEYNNIANIINISERVKTCLQDSEEIPRDLTNLFDDQLFSLDMKNLPKVITGFADLKIKHEPLPLISPQFETPLPPLKPAIYAPRFYEPDAPLLELFDLDEHFSSENARMAQLTNKCTDEDLEFYVRECAEILGVTRHLQQKERDAKGILAYIASRVLDGIIRYHCPNPGQLDQREAKTNFNDSLSKIALLATISSPTESFRFGMRYPMMLNIHQQSTASRTD